MTDWPQGEFSTIVADPPWPYQTGTALTTPRLKDGTVRNDVGAATERYSLMNVTDIAALPVESISRSDAHLYLWTTNSFIVEAHAVARSWGFQPKTVITWVKTIKGSYGIPDMRMGYWYRSATEHVIFAVRGRLRLLGAPAPTAFLHHRLPHSVKPDAFFALVARQSPPHYLELFARKPRTGWTVWGTEKDTGPQAPRAAKAARALGQEPHPSFFP